MLRAAAAAGVALAAYLTGLWLTTPDVEALTEGPAPVSSVMRIDAERSGVHPEPPAFVPLSAVTPLLACAVVKAEDVRFFAHEGFDWPQVWHALRHFGTRGGASTITQQLARNMFLNQERTIHRKLREAFAAHRLESELPKERILELYLNVVPLGPDVWGVREGSAYHFGKTPAELDLFEVVHLTSRIAAPNAELAGGNLDRARSTQQRVLDALYMSGLVEGDDYEATHAQFGFDPHERKRRATAAPLPLSKALEQGCGYEREVLDAFKSG